MILQFKYTPFNNNIIKFYLLTNVYYFTNNLLSFYSKNIIYLHPNFIFIWFKGLLFPKIFLIIKIDLHISFIILNKSLLQGTNNI